MIPRVISTPPAGADAVYETDVALAWKEYADCLRALEPARYDEAEPWAWSRLGRRLASARERLHLRTR